MKYHPDRGGDTEKMAAINNLKEKILQIGKSNVYE